MRIVFAILAILPGLAFAQSISEKAAQDQVVDMKDEEPAMQRAFEKARSTLDDFLVKSKAPLAGTSSYSLKLAVRGNSETEYFWVNEFTWSGDSFTGRINNEPRLVKGIKLGQLYKFSRSQIVDWTYLDEKSRKTYGNFTACALLSKEPPGEAEELKRRYGLQCQ
ncbi:DUF2314 domain-containing protein [Ideonella sp. DXS29W]|uniref:DUF2314 domain-containing protein n=1 Tax=Ideonella lacteola TaxID=2984193 RepID=A0ABU9BZ75_9BURK